MGGGRADAVDGAADHDDGVSTPVADQPRRDGPDDGRGPASPDGSRRSRRARSNGDPALTVEAMLARSRGTAGDGAAGETRARRRHRAERGEDRPSAASPQQPTRSEPGAETSRPPEPTASAPPRQDRPGPPTPGTPGPPSPVTSELPAQQAARRPAPSPAARPAGDAVRHSAPVPRLPGTDGVRHSAPVPRLPGTDSVRYSTPVPPLPGRGPRTSAPLPPIPGLDVPAAEPAPRTRAERRAAMSPLRRRLLRAALVLTVLVALVGAYYAGLYFVVDRSVQRVAALSPDAPEVLAPLLQEGDETYLIVGTGVPGATGAASVTTLIAHVSADRDRAVLVTVPPTALVDTPECRDADGGLRTPRTGSFADALLEGGPSCLVRAVQQLSGLRVDHYLSVDLAGLSGMVDALGSVPVCLAGGTSTGSGDLTGEEVTALLSPGSAGPDVTGAELAQRGQQVLSTTLQTGLDLGNLVDPVTATTFLTRAGDALTLDEGGTLGDVRALADTLGELPADAVQRTSVPVARVGYVPSGSSTAHVLLDGDAARQVFDSVIQDDVLPEATADPAAATPAETTAVPTAGDDVTQAGTVTVAPGDVTVDVLDATGGAAEDLGATVAAGLTAQGFRTGVVGTEPGAVGQTLVRYGPASLERARTVAAAVPGAVLTPSDAVGDAVQLVVASPDVAVQPVVVGAAVPETAVRAASSGNPATCG